MNGIVSRLQVFLAKIAGKDVDVSTLTPPVAINEEEKLMLDIADRIDAIEEGGGGGGAALIVNGSDDVEVMALDKTWKEIKDAFIAGTSVLIHYADNEWEDNRYVLVDGIGHNGEQYYVYVNSSIGGADSFATLNENGYPEYAW